MTYLGDNIRMYRERKKISQTQLAEYCGIKASMVSQIENNGKVPNFILGMKIARLLDVTAEQLVTGKEK
jgi:transcriptional regulator with XRE-family HTH domain